MININELLKARAIELDREKILKDLIEYLIEIGLERESVDIFAYRKKDDFNFFIRVDIIDNGFRVDFFNRYVDRIGQWEEDERDVFFPFDNDNSHKIKFEEQVKKFISSLL